MKLIFISLFLFLFINCKSQCSQQFIYNSATSIDTNELFLRSFDFNKIIYTKKINNFELNWKIKLKKGYNYRFRLFEDDMYCQKGEFELLLVKKENFKYVIIVKTTVTNNSIDFLCNHSGKYFVIIKSINETKIKDCCNVIIMSVVF